MLNLISIDTYIVNHAVPISYNFEFKLWQHKSIKVYINYPIFNCIKSSKYTVVTDTKNVLKQNSTYLIFILVLNIYYSWKSHIYNILMANQKYVFFRLKMKI